MIKSRSCGETYDAKNEWCFDYETNYSQKLVYLYLTFFHKSTEVNPLTTKNQSVDFQSKSTDWFLYDGNIGR